MRALEVQWSRALGVVYEVVLTLVCNFVGHITFVEILNLMEAILNPKP